MKLGYSCLGNFIRQVNNRNADLSISNLIGVTLDKRFIPSVANIVDTDMSIYKVIRNGQFACKLMSVGRDKKLPVSYYEDSFPSIISSAYYVFEIINNNELLDDYLMMWFLRPETDRYLGFISGGDVRGSISWDDFCTIEIKVPSIQKQKEIVKEYNSIIGRKKLNEELNQKLEETAQALYKHWFVDFEFPNETGEPYKSSGGVMIYNKELDKEIPKGWELKRISDFALKMKSGSTPNRSTMEYWSSKDIPWIKTGELKNSVLISSEECVSHLALKKCPITLLPISTVLVAMYGQGDTKGQVGYLKIPATTNQACCAMICNDELKATFLYYHLRVNRDEIVSVAIGGAQPNLSKEIIENIKLVVPEDTVMSKHPFVKIMKHRENLTIETKALIEFKIMLLSRMSMIEEPIENY
jgi:type I restriction enzyme, S subunit